MNPCISCGLALPPGSSHASASDCVEALRHALDEAMLCGHCKEPVSVVAHAGCLVKMAHGRVGDAAIESLGRKAADAVSRLFRNSETHYEGEGDREGEGKGRSKGKKPWKP